MTFIDALPQRYRVILCDIWGVVHDGVNLYPGSAERLLQWRDEGRTIILITNAPRTAGAVEAQLGRIGLPRSAWDGISTSGEAGIAALKALNQQVGFIGTRADREILESRGLELVEVGFSQLACTGLDDERLRVEEYRSQLEALSQRDTASLPESGSHRRSRRRNGAMCWRPRRRLRRPWWPRGMVRKAFPHNL